MTGKTVLVTGGAGYIGSHTVLALAEAGYDPVIYDSFVNASRHVLPRLNALAKQTIPVIEGDCRDRKLLARTFAEHDIHAVLHFAGLKAVGESVEQPLRYYDYNVGSFIQVLDAARQAGTRHIVLSSSATVYAPYGDMPIPEDAPLGPTNPYGQSKLMCEQVARDLCVAEDEMGVALMRYFNPIGAHPSGRIGEAPSQIPNNLMPYIAMVGTGQLERLTVHGDDYDTPDGTGVRDYIHVQDLARGHVLALAFLDGRPGAHVFNLGTGRGSSVLDAVSAYEQINGCAVPYVVGPRRPGDQASVVADPSRARSELGFATQYGMQDACAHSYGWRSANPQGYDMPQG